MKLDSKTIVALTGLVGVLTGGAELRMAVDRLDDKVTRLEERTAHIERTVAPGRLAAAERPDRDEDPDRPVSGR